MGFTSLQAALYTGLLDINIQEGLADYFHPSFSKTTLNESFLLSEFSVTR